MILRVKTRIIDARISVFLSTDYPITTVPDLRKAENGKGGDCIDENNNTDNDGRSCIAVSKIKLDLKKFKFGARLDDWSPEVKNHSDICAKCRWDDRFFEKYYYHENESERDWKIQRDEN